MRKVKVLSIDGGGIRGLIPLKILKMIQQRAEVNHITELFDVMAGTSTGGIIVLALNTINPATKKLYTIKEVIEIYTEEGSEIFKHDKVSFKEKILQLFPSALMVLFFLYMTTTVATKGTLKINFPEFFSAISNRDTIKKLCAYAVIPSLAGEVIRSLPAIYQNENNNRLALLRETLWYGVKTALRASLYATPFLGFAKSGTDFFQMAQSDKIAFASFVGAVLGFVSGLLKADFKKGVIDAIWFALMAGRTGINNTSLSCIVGSLFHGSFKILNDRCIRPFISSKYGSPQNYFIEKFGAQEQLGHLKKPVLVTSRNIRTHDSKKFKSTSEQDKQLPIYGVAMATSAAPTFFPPVLINNDYHVDGGIGSNNPSEAALSYAKDLYDDSMAFLLLSLGTGIEKPKPQSFLGNMKVSILDVLSSMLVVLTGGEDVHKRVSKKFEKKSIIGEYIRIQTKLTDPISLDSVSKRNIESLSSAAETTIKEESEQISRVVATFK